MTKTIDKTKMYQFTKLWITDASQVDKSKWTYSPMRSQAWLHGPRMAPTSRTGQMCIMAGMDARINHGTTRTGEAMIKFVTELATKVGMDVPERIGRNYSRSWLNEGLIKEVE